MTEAEKILQEYEPLARKIAWQHRWSGLDREDLIQTAKLGMLGGLEKYDPEKGALVMCLEFGARNELRSYIRKAAYPVAATTKQASATLPRIRKIISAAVSRGLSPSEARQEAAREMGMSIEDVDIAAGIMTPSAGDDVLAEMSGETGESWIEESDRWTALMQALGALDDDQRELILMRYVEGFTWEKIGKRIGVTHRTAMNRHDKAIKIIRARMKNLSFDDLF